MSSEEQRLEDVGWSTPAGLYLCTYWHEEVWRRETVVIDRPVRWGKKEKYKGPDRKWRHTSRDRLAAVGCQLPPEGSYTLEWKGPCNPDS